MSTNEFNQTAELRRLGESIVQPWADLPIESLLLCEPGVGLNTETCLLASCQGHAMLELRGTPCHVRAVFSSFILFMYSFIH